MKHPLKVEGYKKDHQQLAKDIANMRYDQVVIFLNALANDLSYQAEGDIKRGRINLATELLKASFSIMEAKLCIEKAWEISEPFMRDKDGI